MIVIQDENKEPQTDVMPYSVAKKTYDAEFEYQSRGTFSPVGRRTLAALQSIKNEYEVLPDQLKIIRGQINIASPFSRGSDIKLGQALIEAANADLEMKRQRQAQEAVRLTDLEADSVAQKALEFGLDFGSQLSLAALSGGLALSVMGARISGSTAEEGLRKYKEEHPNEDLRGFYEQSGKELLLNAAKTGVNLYVEKIFGAPKRVSQFRKALKTPAVGAKGVAKAFAKGTAVGGAEEFATESIQGFTDATFDYFLGRFNNADEMVEAYKQGVSDAVYAGVFGGAVGGSGHIIGRAKAIKATKEMLKEVVPAEDLENVSTAIVDNHIEETSELIATEISLSEGLRTKRGEMYNAFKRESEKAIRNSGVIRGMSESEIAQYVEDTANLFADQVLAEATKRNTAITDVVNANDIVYDSEKQELRLSAKTEQSENLKLMQEMSERINEIDKQEANAGISEYTAPTININGLERQTTNSSGEPIAKSEKALKYFYDWFGDSKVVDEQGRPLVVYHGTNAQFDTFDISKAGNATNATNTTLGFFFTPHEDYAKTIGKKIMPVYLKALNMFELGFAKNGEDYLTGNKKEQLNVSYFSKDYEFVDGLESIKKAVIKKYGDYNKENVAKWSKLIKDMGYDGIKVITGDTPTFESDFIPTAQYVVFEPNQIKSVENRGTFSTESENIYEQSEYTGESETAYKKSLDETKNIIKKLDEIQKATTTEKEVDSVKAQNEGRNVIEFNIESFNDQESMAYMKETAIKKYKMTEKEFEDLAEYMKKMSEEIKDMAEKNGHKMFSRWNKREIARYLNEKGNLLPIISAFKTNGDYPLNFDLSSLCTRREATNAVVKSLIEMGYAQQLGTTQLEALKDILREADYTTACDICFVESKRLRQLAYANSFAYEWQSVRMALGLTDDSEVGTPRKFTPEQEKILSEMTSRKKTIRQQAFDKYIPEERKRVYVEGKQIDSGITPDKMQMIAKLFKQDSSFGGVFNAEWLMSSYGVDWLMRTYPKTDIRSVLSAMYGTATPKPIEGFNIYDPLSWKLVYDTNQKADKLQKIFSIGGFRGQSFSDFNSLQAFDYFQFFCDLAIRHLPIHMYTKVPALVKLFGETGCMFNMSLVPEMVLGVDQEHAGLKPDGKGGWEYAWSKDSFPIEEAYALRKDNRYGGRVGTIAVGVSDAHILKMLDDPNIDMIIPYHISGMPLHTRVKTGLNRAKNYTDFQTTKGPKKGKDFQYNEQLQKIGDPKKTAEAYLNWCEENGYTPKFEQFKDHENYYKLLEDFRGYDNNGNPVLQQSVDMSKIDPKTFAKELDGILTEREKEVTRQENIHKEKDVMRKINRLMSKQKIDAGYREALVTRLKNSLGKNNVLSLRQQDFNVMLRRDLEQTRGVEESKRMLEIFRKNDGVVYGYTLNNVIYLNENVFNANTPAHEFTHIWANVAKNKNPELWEDGKALLKESDVWNEVMEDSLYMNIRGNEDAVASEVLSRIVGRENEELIRKSIDPKYKPLKEQSAITSRIMSWFKKLWGEVRSLFDYSRDGKPLTYDEFIHMPLKDLWDETRNIQFNKSLNQQNIESLPELSAEDTYGQVTGLPKQKAKTKGTFDAKSKVIKLFEDADTSTLPHELAHFWLDNMFNYANSGMASDNYIAQFDAVKKFLNVKQDQKYLNRTQHENFARAYEKYLYNGKVPNSIMGNVFDDYSKYLKNVYDSIKSIGNVKLNDEIINFFDSMIKGGIDTTTLAEDTKKVVETRRLEESAKEVERQEKETKKVIEERQAVVQENRYTPVTPLQTDTKTGYLTAYEKMTGQKVEAGSIVLETEMKRAEDYVNADLQRAQDIIDGKLPMPTDILDNAFFIAYNEVQSRLGNTENVAKSMLQQANMLRRYGQEIVSQRLQYNNVFEKYATPQYWIEKLTDNKLESAASKVMDKSLRENPAKLEKEINERIDRELKQGKGINEITNKIAEDYGLVLKQKEVKVENETLKRFLKYGFVVQDKYGEDVKVSGLAKTAANNELRRIIKNKLDLGVSEDVALEIYNKAKSIQDALNNTVDNITGNPSIEYFSHLSEMESYINSLTPSSGWRLLTDFFGPTNLMLSVKTPALNIESNIIMHILRMVSRRVELGKPKNLVDKEFIKNFKKDAMDLWNKTQYTTVTMTSETPEKTILGEKFVHTEGIKKLKVVADFYNNFLKYGLGWGDMVFKVESFVDSASLQASKEALDMENVVDKEAKATEIFKDAVKIIPQTEIGKRIREKAQQDALVTVFQNTGILSDMSIKMRRALDKIPGLGKTVIAFAQTPANYIGYSAKVTTGLPVELGKLLANKVAKKKYKQDWGILAQSAIAYFAGSIIAFGLDDDDYMPPYTLASSREKEVAKELNIPFNSIKNPFKKLGIAKDTWISLDYFGPIAPVISGMLQYRKERNVLKSLLATGFQVSSVPAFGGISNLIEKEEKFRQEVMTKDSEIDVAVNSLKELFDFAYSRIVPAIVNDLSKAIDIYDRDTEAYYGYGKEISKIPFARFSLEEKTSLTTGKEKERGYNLLTNAISDIVFGGRVGTQPENAVANELKRLSDVGQGVALGDVTKRGLLSKLPEKIKQEVRKNFAKEYASEVNALISSGYYSSLSDEEKKEEINDIRKEIVKELREDYKNILQD